MIVRAWNVFHGNTSPPGRRSYLREMIELVTADRPGIVCLQEVPPWAFDKVGEWSDMQAVSVRTRKPKLGPLPLGARLSGRMTAINSGLFRSGFQGQGNVILLPKDAKITQTKQITLNTNPFCEEQTEKFGLEPKRARWWEKERRVCHLAKIQLPNRRRLCVANLHVTSHAPDLRFADAELRRAASFVDRASELDEIVVFAGDFNTTLASSETLQMLTTREDDRFSPPAPYIDHVLVRGAIASTIKVWPDDDRRYDGKLLSDHAPVEVEILAKVKRRKKVEEPQPAKVEGASEAEAPPRQEKEDDAWETKGRWETEEESTWETEGGWETERS
jgi:endonuclease/exonuclease/phosphatase family metal-dependent hydrolase